MLAPLVFLGRLARGPFVCPPPSFDGCCHMQPLKTKRGRKQSGGPAAPGHSLLALGAALRPPHTIFLGSLPWGDTLGGLLHLSCTAHSSLAGPVSAVSSTW